MTDRTIKIRKQDYVISQELEVLADKVIHAKNMGIENVEIKYLLVYPNINKFTAGRCSKSNVLVTLRFFFCHPQ